VERQGVVLISRWVRMIASKRDRMRMMMRMRRIASPIFSLNYTY